jgi:hypothetical protein
MHRGLATGALTILVGVVLTSVGRLESTASTAEAAGALECSVPLILPAAPSNRPKYVLNIRIGHGLKDASGTLAVSFEPMVPTDRLVFRLWPNSPFYAGHGARLTVGPVTAGGRALKTSRPNATTLVVNRALAAGERMTVSMSWKLRLPQGDGYQLKGGGSARLASFFPILAWDGSGWAVDPPPRVDSFWATSPTADFDVRIVTPRGLRVLASGSEVRAGQWRARSVRDFALAVGSFAVRRTTVRLPEPVRVVIGLERGSSYPIGAFVSETMRALRWYSQRYGGYPWPRYTVAVMKDFIGWNGYAYPTIGFLADGSLFLVPHETAHQWFYSLVGNNQARDPWLSEGTATWAQTGPERSLAAMRATSIPADVRNRLGEPMSFWASRGFEKMRLGVYVQTVQALDELGDSATVDCALRQFVVQNAYRTTTPRDLLAALQAYFPDAEQKLSARGAQFDR